MSVEDLLPYQIPCENEIKIKKLSQDSYGNSEPQNLEEISEESGEEYYPQEKDCGVHQAIKTDSYYLELMSFLRAPIPTKTARPEMNQQPQFRYINDRTSSLPSTIPSIPTTNDSPISHDINYQEGDDSFDSPKKLDHLSIPYSEKSSEDISYHSGISIQDLAQNLPIDLGFSHEAMSMVERFKREGGNPSL